MSALICGSFAYDSIMVFPGRFADQILPDISSTAIQRIRHLETENETMKRRLYAKDRQIQLLQAQLDSLAGHAVDRN